MEPSHASGVQGRHWVLWDGECGMCARFADWVRRRDAQGCLEVVAFQQAPSPPMTPSLAAACTRAVHVVTDDGVVLRGGRATLFILGRLGWRRWAGLLAMPPLVWGVEAGYRIVAANRAFFSRLLR